MSNPENGSNGSNGPNGSSNDDLQPISSQPQGMTPNEPVQNQPVQGQGNYQQPYPQDYSQQQSFQQQPPYTQQQPYSQQPPYPQQQQPYPQPYPQAYPQQGFGDVSIGEWIGTMLLLLIPIVNIVLVFVWAFGSETKRSKSNFFKAYLILAVIGIVLGIVLSVLLGGAILAFINEVGYMY